MNKININDVVALLENFKEHGLSRGDVGTVVETLSDDTFLVEISDSSGKALKMAELNENQIMKLNYSYELA